jgi:hypothetical protein
MHWINVTIEVNEHQARLLERERRRFASLVAEICPAPSFEEFASSRLAITRKGIHAEDMGRLSMRFGYSLCDAYRLVPADEPERRRSLALQLAAAFLQSIFWLEAPQPRVSELENA